MGGSEGGTRGLVLVLAGSVAAAAPPCPEASFFSLETPGPQLVTRLASRLGFGCTAAAATSSPSAAGAGVTSM